ncbi:MAG: hypothetical protein B9S32_14935 [Verrucomicrobia bacterium Tous-C9LFEB]|nr:MAG: hypothetical protein B9S32_14935 [Verrucomicrobia bacterium Tous-C9LFEB]
MNTSPTVSVDSPVDHRQAFTLIESLTTVAIISILAIVLIPTVEIVRESTQNATCLANLRQIGMLMSLYANDNSGRLPPSYNLTLENYHSWPYAVMQSAGYTVTGIDTLDPKCSYRDQAKTVFKCPTLLKLRPASWLTYSMNHAAASDTSGNNFREGLRISSVANPARQIVVTDGAKTSSFFSSTLDNIAYIGTFHRTSNSSTTGGYQIANGQAHILCLDGHVGLITREEITRNTHDYIFNPALNK